MKIYITAQALKRNELMQNLHAKSPVITEHIFKLIVMPDHTARNHWESEIAGQLNRITSLKSTKKYPSAKELMTWLYYDYEDDISNIRNISNDLDNISDDYGVYYEGNIYELAKDFKEICFEYFSWLSKELSINGSVRNREIYNKLDELV